MTLLIPCSNLYKEHDNFGFGSLMGEIEVPLAAFRQAVTMFCLASPEDEESWPNRVFLAYAKQYNIWNKNLYGVASHSGYNSPVYLWSELDTAPTLSGITLNTKRNYSNVTNYPTTTNSVLDDIRHRSLENEEDRIPILANALMFHKRLDIRKTSPLMEPGRFSLSAAILALILMNGEILLNSEYDDLPFSIMRCTLPAYLKRCEYRFNAPSFQLQQSFINRCRFKAPTITARGIETKGFLFKLLPHHASQGRVVRITPEDRRDLSKRARDPLRYKLLKTHRLKLPARDAIDFVIDRLEDIWPNSRLASYLTEQLELDGKKVEEMAPSTPYVLDMMSAIYQALMDDREIRLARLASKPDTTEPTAIFIAPEPHRWATEEDEQDVYIFTSWDNPPGPYDRESLASLEVSMFDKNGTKVQQAEAGGGSFLKSYGWVNGVWVVRGDKMGMYSFPLLGITAVPDALSKERRLKRKRSVHLDKYEVE